MLISKRKSEQKSPLKDKVRSLHPKVLSLSLATPIILAMIFSDINQGQVKVGGIEFGFQRTFREELEMFLKTNSKGELQPEAGMWIDYLSKLEFDTPLSKRVRELLRTGQGPFSLDKKVKVIWSSTLPEGIAAVCQKGALFQEPLLLINNSNTRTATVKAVIPLSPCEVASIQISSKDALNLLNVRDNRELPQDFEATISLYIDLPSPPILHSQG